MHDDSAINSDTRSIVINIISARRSAGVNDDDDDGSGGGDSVTFLRRQQSVDDWRCADVCR